MNKPTVQRSHLSSLSTARGGLAKATALHRQQGVTLIEILIGSMLGLFLLGGLLQISSSTHTNNRASSSLSELQENGRFALDQMVSTLRYRGFQGCLTSKDAINSNNPNDPDGAVFTSKAKGLNIPSMADGHLRGFDVSSHGTWGPAPSLPDMVALANADPKPVAGTDIISLTYASPNKIDLAADMVNKDDSITLADNNIGLKKGDVVFIGNCTAMEAFRISNEVPPNAPFILEHDASVNEVTDSFDVASTSTNTFFNHPYKMEDASVRSFQSDTYYIGKTDRKAQYGGDIFALYRYDALGESTELIEGVENMQILYGEETDELTNAIRYVPANTPDLNMRRVKSIQVSFLIHSTESPRSSADTQTYALADQQIAGHGTTITHQGNKMMRRVYSSTINLRNRF